MVSALNAMIELARNGYSQKICVLTRTVAEFISHIEFVLERGSEEHRTEVNEYVKAVLCGFGASGGS